MQVARERAARQLLEVQQEEAHCNSHPDPPALKAYNPDLPPAVAQPGSHPEKGVSLQQGAAHRDALPHSPALQVQGYLAHKKQSLHRTLQ